MAKFNTSLLFNPSPRSNVAYISAQVRQQELGPVADVLRGQGQRRQPAHLGRANYGRLFGNMVSSFQQKGH